MEIIGNVFFTFMVNLMILCFMIEPIIPDNYIDRDILSDLNIFVRTFIVLYVAVSCLF